MPAKKKPANLDDIANKTLAGISEAQNKYEYWTGGCWLWEAPEYMVTTLIAKHISAFEDIYTTLEHNVRGALKDAGGQGRGRPRKALRPDGKFDILLWRENGNPMAVIEVKNQVTGFSYIRADVSRICATLKRSNTSRNTIRCGFIAYYTSLNNGKRKPAKKRVIDRVEGIAKKVEKFANDEGMNFKRYPGRVKVVGNDGGAWTAEVLKISRRRRTNRS